MKKTQPPKKIREAVVAYLPESSNFVRTQHEAFMRSNIRKVGNSRGIILPAAFIAACGFGSEVELSIEGSRLIIEAARAPRSGWLDGYNPFVDQDVLASLPLDDSEEEWVW